MKCPGLYSIASLFILFFSVSGFSQDSAQYDKLVLKINPLSVIDIGSFPTIQLGVEARLTHRLALEFDYAHSYISHIGKDIYNLKGYKSSLELRRYFNQRPNKRNYYLALRVFFSERSYTDKGTLNVWGDTLDNDSTYEAAYHVRKTVFTSSLIAGYERHFSKRFSFDLFVGLGYRGRRVFKSYPHENMHAHIDSGFYIFNENWDLYNLVLGIKFGFKLI